MKISNYSVHITDLQLPAKKSMKNSVFYSESKDRIPKISETYLKNLFIPLSAESFLRIWPPIITQNKKSYICVVNGSDSGTKAK